MKIIISILNILVCSNYLYSQDKYDYQWVLDKYILMDFRNNTLNVSKMGHVSDKEIGNNCTSICDKNGNLMFSTGGCYIMNRNNGIMKNGDSITSKYAYSNWCSKNESPFLQSTLILPFPEDSLKYIAFNLDVQLDTTLLPPQIPLNLLYHVIDMSKEGGLGAVTENRKIAISDILSRSGIQAARHSDGKNWWLIAPKFKSNCYYVFSITSRGVQAPSQECIGHKWNEDDDFTQSTFSPDAKMYARVDYFNGLHVYFFDNNTGRLAPFVSIPMSQLGSDFYRGISFSPNSRFLYVTSYLKVYQYDLKATNIQESVKIVGVVDNSTAPPGADLLFQQRIAPDGRIYIGSLSDYKFLSVINKPNLLGTACDFKQYSIQLPNYTRLSIPNLPYFYIPQFNENSTATDEVTPKGDYIMIRPNPFNSHLEIRTKRVYHKYKLSTILGKLVKTGNIYSEVFEIHTADIDCGMYFLSIFDEIGNIISTKKVVKQN
jgi:hypothetical protein